MRVIPNLELLSLHVAYGRRAQTPFDALGAKLGLDVPVTQLSRALRVVDEHDLFTMLPILLHQLYTALASEHAYGYEHVSRPGCRIYTCLAVRDGDRVIASVQRSATRNPFPDPGWRLPRWNEDEPSRNVKTVTAWARDPERTNDAGVFPIVAPLRESDSLAPDDVRSTIAALEAQIESLAPRDPERANLVDRARDLVEEHRPLIVGDLARIIDASVNDDGLDRGVAIRRGVLDGIAVRASRLASTIDTLPDLPRRVRVQVDRERAWIQLVESGVLGRIRDLEITGWQSRPMKRLEVDITQLASSPLHATERLSLSWLESTDDAWARLLSALDAPALRALRIDHAGIGPRGLALLASARLFPGLTELALGDPSGDRDEVRAILPAVGTRGGLRALSLTSISDHHEAAIAQILEQSELTSIALDLGDAILEPLAAALAKRPFDRVALDGNHVTPHGIERLIRSPGFANLARFALLVGWDLAPLADALLATNGHTRLEVRDLQSLPAAVHDHLRVSIRR